MTDGAGRTVQSIDGFNNATLFAYDGNGNTTQVTDRDGKVTKNAYDARNRTMSTIGDFGVGGGYINATTGFLYDLTSNLTQVTDADNKVTVYAYDTANRRLTTTYASGTADASTWTVSYKPLGQVLTLTKPNGIVITYSVAVHSAKLVLRNFAEIVINGAWMKLIVSRMISAKAGSTPRGWSR